MRPRIRLWSKLRLVMALQLLWLSSAGVWATANTVAAGAVLANTTANSGAVFATTVIATAAHANAPELSRNTELPKKAKQVPAADPISNAVAPVTTALAIATKAAHQANTPRLELSQGYLIGPLEYYSDPAQPVSKVTTPAVNLAYRAIYAGTVRQYWVYQPKSGKQLAAPKQPAAHRLSAPAKLPQHMADPAATCHRQTATAATTVITTAAAAAPDFLLFHDGQRAVNAKGSLHLPQQLDELIATGQLAPVLAVFVTPGELARHYPADLGFANPGRRGVEYDAVNGFYAEFLRQEFLPMLAQHYQFSADPARRVIGGSSSGGSAAFGVAWHAPDLFQNVLSLIGSYVAIGYQAASADTPIQPGADIYPTLIRKQIDLNQPASSRPQPKPLKLFLQDGQQDLSNEHGDWFLANQQMVSALQWVNQQATEAGQPPPYQLKYRWTNGGHSDQDGGQLLKEILPWLFASGCPQ